MAIEKGNKISRQTIKPSCPYCKGFGNAALREQIQKKKKKHKRSLC